MRLEQAHHLLAGRHRFAVEHAPLGLLHHPLEQVPAGAHLGTPTLGPRLSYATHFGHRVGDRVRHRQQVGGRPPLLAARRADLLLAPLGSTAVVVTPAAGARAPAAASAPARRRTTGGCPAPGYPSRHGADTRLVDSIPRCLASCNSTPLIACHVSASIAPTALCNADFFGHERIDPCEALHGGGIEQRELQPPIAVAPHEHRTQNGLAGQPRATAAGGARQGRSCRASRAMPKPLQFGGDRSSGIRVERVGHRVTLVHPSAGLEITVRAVRDEAWSLKNPTRTMRESRWRTAEARIAVAAPRHRG